MANCEIIIRDHETNKKEVWFVPRLIADEINTILEDFVKRQKPSYKTGNLEGKK